MGSKGDHIRPRRKIPEGLGRNAAGLACAAFGPGPTRGVTMQRCH
jgi:hypothetical protein